MFSNMQLTITLHIEDGISWNGGRDSPCPNHVEYNGRSEYGGAAVNRQRIRTKKRIKISFGTEKNEGASIKINDCQSND